MSQVVLRPKPGIFAIRAYCSKCGAMLLQSNPLTKKQLHAVWDRSVIQAVQIKCEACGFKFPNFNINLRVVNTRTGREYEPFEIIKAKHKEDPVKLFESVSKQWLKEHPDATPPTKEEIIAAVTRQRNSQFKAHGEERPDSRGDNESVQSD